MNFFRFALILKYLYNFFLFPFKIILSNIFMIIGNKKITNDKIPQLIFVKNTLIFVENKNVIYGFVCQYKVGYVYKKVVQSKIANT